MGLVVFGGKGRGGEGKEMEEREGLDWAIGDEVSEVMVGGG